MTPGETLVADTSALYSYFNRSAPDHRRTVDALEAHEGPIVLSPYIAAELDYLVMTRLGVGPELRVLAELSSGAFDFPLITPADLVRMTAVVDAYRDQSIGLADASLVVLADLYGTNRLFTLDRRHFTVVRPLRGGEFELVP